MEHKAETEGESVENVLESLKLCEVKRQSHFLLLAAVPFGNTAICDATQIHRRIRAKNPRKPSCGSSVWDLHA